MSAVTKLRSSGLGSIFAILFVDLVGFGIVFPLYAAILAYYGRQDHGLLHWMMEAVATIHPGADAGQRAALFGGLLGAIYAGLQFFAAPFWGRLSDRIGRRPVLLISLVGWGWPPTRSRGTASARSPRPCWPGCCPRRTR